jgi:sodium-dependent dicarboxylate transporter 2/3/5
MVVTWWWLGVFFGLKDLTFAVRSNVFRQEYNRLGPMSFGERIVLADFLGLAALWLTREGVDLGSVTLPGWSSLWPDSSLIDDGTVAIALALLLYWIPSRRNPGERILDWATTQRLPWGIVLLFGGGFALAQGFVDSGLSAWLGNRMEGLSGLPPLWVVLAVCLLMTFLTELTSNTATTQMALPILAAVAVALQVNPLLLMVPATLSASCAFMLPVATPPNAIIFGTERIRSGDMARAGIILNLVGAILITLAIFLWGQTVMGIDAGQFPEWALP